MAGLIDILAKAETIPEASAKAEKCVKYVSCTDGWNVFHRSDIGSETLLNNRIEQAQLIRDMYRYRESKGLIGVTIEWIPKRGKIVLKT